MDRFSLKIEVDPDASEGAVLNVETVEIPIGIILAFEIHPVEDIPPASDEEQGLFAVLNQPGN